MALSARSARSPKPSRMMRTSGFGRAVIRATIAPDMRAWAAAGPGHPQSVVRAGDDAVDRGDPARPARARPREGRRSARGRGRPRRDPLQPEGRSSVPRRRAKPRGRGRRQAAGRRRRALRRPSASAAAKRRQAEARAEAAPGRRMGRVHRRRVLGQPGAGRLGRRARVARRARCTRGSSTSAKRRTTSPSSRPSCAPSSGSRRRRAASSSTPTASTRSACCRRAGGQGQPGARRADEASGRDAAARASSTCPGHSGVPLNERADELAREAIATASQRAGAGPRRVSAVALTACRRSRAPTCGPGRSRPRSAIAPAVVRAGPMTKTRSAPARATPRGPRSARSRHTKRAVARLRRAEAGVERARQRGVGEPGRARPSSFPGRSGASTRRRRDRRSRAAPRGRRPSPC